MIIKKYADDRKRANENPRKSPVHDKTVFLFVDTVTRGKKIVYYYPHDLDYNDLNLADKLKIDNERDFKEQIPGLLTNLIEYFLVSTDMCKNEKTKKI